MLGKKSGDDFQNNSKKFQSDKYQFQIYFKLNYNFLDMKQVNISKSSVTLKEESSSNNNFDNQINKLLQKRPLRNHTILKISKKVEDLHSQIKKLSVNCVSNYNLDDSSDEEDVYYDVSREEIKKLNQIIHLDDANSAIILELEGRKVLYSKQIREKYLEKKQNYFKFENNHNLFVEQVKLVINDFLTSIKEAIENLVDSIKSFIKFQLNQDTFKISDQFYMIILENLINLFQNDQKLVKKWLRMAVRFGKNEVLDIPEQILDIIDKTLTKFVVGFKKRIEEHSKRKMEDKKYQLQFFQMLIKNLQELYTENKEIEPFLVENLGEVFFVSHQVQNFIIQKNQSLTFESISARFQEENKYLFDNEYLKKIFLMTQNLVYKKLGNIQHLTCREALPKVYYSQPISGFVDLMSEIHLIRRSIIRSTLNGNNESVFSLVFDSKNDIIVQLHYSSNKNSIKNISSRIINFELAEIKHYLKVLDLNQKEFSQCLRLILKQGMENNILLQSFTKQKKQILANFAVYFFCQLGHQSPCSFIMINMTLDLIQNEQIPLQHLFFLVKHEKQLENWISQQVNEICLRQHIQLNEYNQKILQGDYEEFIQKRAWIVYNWIKFYRKIYTEKRICQDEMVKFLLKEMSNEWFNCQIQNN